MTELLHRQHRTQPPARAEWPIIAVALVLPTLVTWIYFVALGSAAPQVQQTAYAIGKTIQFLLPVVWVLGVQRERLAWNWPRGRYWLIGALFGLAVATAMLALYVVVLRSSEMFAGAEVAIRHKVTSFGAGSPIAFLGLAVFYSAIHSLLEEYYWRWFVFGRLGRVCWWPVAIAISSVAFAAHHVLLMAMFFGWLSPLTWLFALAIAIGGAVWAWLYRLSGSLFAPWLSHALVDAAIFGIGYSILVA